MAITTTTLGPNSGVVAYTAGSTADEILAAIRVFAVAHGWTVHHQVTGQRLVLRARNADGVGFKYLELAYSTSSNGSIQMQVWESWNETTSTGTNAANFGTTAAYWQRLTLASGGSMFLFVTARYFIMLSRTSDGVFGAATGLSWTGVLEISKDNADEVDGANPIAAWACGPGFVGSLCTSASALHCFSYPRTISGQTAVNASASNTVTTIAGSTSSQSASARLADQLPAVPNPLSAAGNLFAFTPYAVSSGFGTAANFNVRGRFYGIKLMGKNIGSMLDTVDIKCDSNQFYSPTGVDTKHYVLTESALGARFAIPA